ncbi:MAG TPA: kynureninase [Flavobacteriales bacterium]|nr:kynureninase [Flavobacteriales bacterium]
MIFEYNKGFAQKTDEADSLKKYRDQFYFPQNNGKPVVYFTGNSLGLQPKTTKGFIEQELNDWAQFGVEGHFHAKRPWFAYHEFLTEYAAKLVGGLLTEVVCMNQLTVNVHMLMVSFYRPTKQRYKIICEAKAFPSDQYALETQVKFHGFDPSQTIVEVQPRAGEHTIRHEDILKTIDEHKNELALVLFGGVNYFTGQVFDMKGITEAGHRAGALVGFDLAHAAGNIALKLHEWDVDFACWCSYKYLNSGPGSVAGAFVHEKHHGKELHRFAGWWGHDKATRFKMEKGFKPINTVEAWQVSNAPVFAMAAHLAALTIFNEAGMENLVAKSKQLTAYLEFVIEEINKKKFNGKKTLEIITPLENRGCQLSVVAHGYGKDLFTKLLANGVIADWREPNVIRMAPVPLYNSFEDVYRFGEILESLL